jgi:hypothetical protein
VLQHGLFYMTNDIFQMHKDSFLNGGWMESRKRLVIKRLIFRFPSVCGDVLADRINRTRHVSNV